MLSKFYQFFSTHLGRLVILITIALITSKYISNELILKVHIAIGLIILIYMIIIILFIWIINPTRDFKQFIKEQKNKENEKNI